MKRTYIHLLAIALIAPLLIAAAPAPKKEVSPVSGKRVSLFNGKDLKGWEVLKCEAVVDGKEILLKAGNGLVQTKKKYADFVLEFECKALAEDKWDSGVYFRYDKVPENKPWPPKYQVNLRKGMEGDVGGIDGVKGKATSLFKAGEWNTFKLTVKGDALDLVVNGKPAWKGKGLDAEPKTGFIALQAETPRGGQFLFRKIYITELKADGAKGKGKKARAPKVKKAKAEAK